MPATLEQIAISASLAAHNTCGLAELRAMVERIAADVAEIKKTLEPKQ